MTRHFPVTLGGLCLAVSLLFLLFPAEAPAVGETLTVKTSRAQVRATPSFTGSVLKTVPYGAHVEIAAEKDAWRQVTAPGGVKGWMHASSLSDRYLVLKAGTAVHTGVAREKEIATAGKGLSVGGAEKAACVGFTARVEQLYRQQHPGGYARLPRQGGAAIAPSALMTFLKAGGVDPETAQ